MQTIEEMKDYIKQLENEVGKWHHAYDALVIERNALVRKILETEKFVSVKDHENGFDCVMIMKEAFEAMSEELEELRKHELAWNLDKAIIKELEAKISTHEKNTGKLIEAYEQKLEAYRRRISAQESELSEMAMHVAQLETELKQKEK